MSKVKIILHNLHFIIKINDKSLTHILELVTSKLMTYTYVFNRKWKRLVRAPDKGYYTYNVRSNEYRFPINIIKDVVILLGHAGVGRENIDLVKDNNFNLTKIDIPWNKDIILRDYQMDYCNAIIENNDKNMFLIDLYTGGGKSACAAYIVHYYKYRTAMLVLPKYIDKWVDDFKKYLLANPEDIYVVQGGDSLIYLMTEPDITYKYIIFSLRTIGNYISDCLSGNEDIYPIPPEDLFKHLKIGLLLNDETHQHFHAVSQAMLYFDAYKFIGSSATFDSNQKELRLIYNRILPPDNRVSNLVKYEPYVYAKCVKYNLEFTKGIKYKRQQGYNHILFEHSILVNSVLREDYLEMIAKYVEEGYLNRRKPGDKLLVFFASIDMCTYATKYFKELYADIKNLNINRYVENDSYESVLTSDISITTHLSAGTAFDIPNLITVIQTVSMRSLQANLQNFGRLRKLKDKETWYYWIYTPDISTQKSMHYDRYDILESKFKEYEEIYYPKRVRSR